jgi:lipopolysaccharide export LptBFGC system permease protein LptF
VGFCPSRLVSIRFICGFPFATISFVTDSSAAPWSHQAHTEPAATATMLLRMAQREEAVIELTGALSGETSILGGPTRASARSVTLLLTRLK